MRLVDLDAQFIQYEKTPTGQVRHHYVDTFAEAHGVMFLCPKCFAANQGPVGTHSVICWFVGKVPDDAFPVPGRWHPIGTSLDNLTFVGPGQASVKITGGCEWHGYVRGGDAT